MADGDSPGAARRRVRLAIREAREAAGPTQAQVAQEMEWSLSKVIRIERGDVTVSANDLRALLGYLKVRDRVVVGALLADARIARTRPRRLWYQQPEFREHMSDAFRRLVEYETGATVIRSYSVYYLPGPLQTPAYAAALLNAWNGEIPSDRVRVLVEARRLRHEQMLARLENVRVFLVVDQSVLARAIGDPQVLADQLTELHDLASRGLLRVRMLPFDLASPIANNGSFDLLCIGDEPDVALMYRENDLTDELVEDRGVTARHRGRFDQLWHAASSQADTIGFIAERIEALQMKISERQSRS